MVDQRIEKLAKLIVQYSVDVKPKEKVNIRSFSELAFPLVNELFKECLLCDAYPRVTITSPLFIEYTPFSYTFFKHAKEHQLKFASPFDKFEIENIDVMIFVGCAPNPKELTNIDPSKIKMAASSQEEYMKIFMRRMAEGKLKWVSMCYPINAQAQEAAMSLPEYEDFVYSSCLIDKENPIEEWKKIGKQQEKICEFLNQAGEIRVIGEDTDLAFSVEGRKWLSCDGKINMPDGEVATGPLEDSANGRVRFTFPGLFGGREVEDIKLSFKNGKVVEASAARGNDLLQETLKIEGADRIGEIGIGTNYGITKFTKVILFDEKMGGTIHIALGASYEGTGGVNKSAIHWDILKDMKKDGEIYADGKLFYKNGKFLI